MSLPQPVPPSWKVCLYLPFSKISFWSPSFRILESRRMTYSPGTTHSMEHSLKLRHKLLPTLLSRSRDLVTPSQTLSLATLKESGPTKPTDSPWPKLGPLPISSATRSNSTISLSRVSNLTSSPPYLPTRAQKRPTWALFISSLVCTLMQPSTSSRSDFFDMFHFLQTDFFFFGVAGSHFHCRHCYWSWWFPGWCRDFI